MFFFFSLTSYLFSQQKGKQQHYELGQWFRKRYANFLPEKYSDRTVYIRSTDVDRTLMSVEANLAGLFIPHGKEIWNNNLQWQPIPIHTKPEKDDALLAMKKPCPKYDILYKTMKNSPEIVEINRKNKKMYEYLSENTGRKVTTMQDMEFIYSVLNIETIYNFTLPKWTKAVFPDKMRSTAAMSFALPCYTKELARLKVGPFMAEMLDHLYNTTTTMKHKYNRKLWVYSGHDTTISNILNAMDIFQYHSPPYTSTIMFELYARGEDQFYVNVLYKNSSIPQKMIIPGCQFDCPLEQFAAILGEVTLAREEWDAECMVSMLNYLPFSHFQSVFVISAVGILVLLLMTILIGIICTKHHQERRQHLSYFRIPDRDEHV